jgi:hypothetical protein
MNAADCERSWVESICFTLADHPDFNVRGNAILGLGHIARTCRELNLDRAVPVISRALGDPNPFVRSHADNAACDLQVYLGASVPGYNTERTEALFAAINKSRRKSDV